MLLQSAGWNDYESEVRSLQGASTTPRDRSRYAVEISEEEEPKEVDKPSWEVKGELKEEDRPSQKAKTEKEDPQKEDRPSLEEISEKEEPKEEHRPGQEHRTDREGAAEGRTQVQLGSQDGETRR